MSAHYWSGHLIPGVSPEKDDLLNKGTGVRRGRKRQERKHTVEWSPCSPNLINTLLRILSLPDTVEAVKCCVVGVEGGIARSGKAITHQTTNGGVAGNVEAWLGRALVEFPSIGSFFETVDVVAAQEEFDILGADLVAPEGIDVAGQTARVVFESFRHIVGYLPGGQGA